MCVCVCVCVCVCMRACACVCMFMFTCVYHLANRKYGSTVYNEHSSRSHTVFRILLSRNKEDHVCKMSILVSFQYVLNMH